MPRTTLSDINKRPDYIPVDGYEAQCHLDTDEFKSYRDRVEQIIKEADKTTDPNYKGLNLSEITRLMGEDGNLDCTANALRCICVQKADLTPERYTFRRREVKFVDQHLWGQRVEKVPGYQYDMKTIASSMYGQRQK